jgi:DNA-binding MarR family transcriptional regulator
VARLSNADYARLLEFRTGLRRFLKWSERQAVAVGITPAQHQLLLAIRGHEGERGPTVGDIADALLLRHHSTVELIDRAAAAGLVGRRIDPDDHRQVRLVLTPNGSRRLEQLSALHLDELARFGSTFRALTRGLDGT